MVVNISGRGDKDIPDRRDPGRESERSGRCRPVRLESHRNGICAIGRPPTLHRFPRKCARAPFMTTRIEARFAELPRRGPRRARHLRDGRRSRPRDVARDPEGLPEAGADIIEFGLPFTDPMADGPAIQAAGLRALKAGQDTVKTLDTGPRASGTDDADTPVDPDGLFQPDLHLRRRALPRRCQRGRRRRPDRRRPAAGGGRRAVPAGAEGRARLHPPGDADHRRQAPAGGAREHGRASSITSRSPASPARRRPISARSRRRWSGSSATRRCRSRSASASRAAPHAAAIARGADGVVVGSALDRRRSRARSTPTTGPPRDRSRPSPHW